MPTFLKQGLLILPLSIYVLAYFYFSTTFTGKEIEYYQKLVLCVASIFSNFYVLYYHYTNPPHPKFLMLPKRKLSIRTHVISGTIEIVFGAIAFFSSNPEIPAIVMALSAIIGHVTSSSYQTPIVFGAKSAMIPSYIFCVSLHLYCAIHLLLEPSSDLWLVNTFLVLSIYVWCRVFYFVFTAFGLFKDNLYSASILAAGVLIFPSVLGVAGNLFFILFVLGYNALYKLIMNPTPAQWISWTKESQRQTLIDEDAKELWISNHLSINSEQLDDRALAAAVFTQLDVNQSGTLDKDELMSLWREWQVPDAFINNFINEHTEINEFNFNEFYEQIWHIKGVKQRLQKETLKLQYLSKGKNISNEEKCRLIFEELDIDRNGYIDELELKILLLEWGLPSSEVEEYMQKYDDNKDLKISFEEFFKMRPVWSFAYSDIILAS
ncbi:calcium-binding protein [Nostoc linckia z18]|uniref:Calcium-binding protein n=2 Tax=Nostoc linckia TaxID=92942 RepID=A0A9Q6EJV2_NOSLI|nr:EF-hand domain-containing protein [Nostoc linckia]PHK40382.1 calcium-binding protein [Nostoc linckia z15]PHK48305.1 calcium-binding protein [Nostoc linckia z16]PHJ62838.1 calcium-binding protein [Nostoc linckia z3]PHJ66755.1 calcium-binding protein [Nostoc linckia z1]PHJ70387.1 calcium-binding protein [Nostoc linckia z2]